MTERTPSLALDPFCPTCGEYKGVGDCKNPGCSDSANSIRRSSLLAICTKCDSQVSSVCGRCGKGYCDNHSRMISQTKLAEFIMTIGTCSICGLRVCESCWIIGDNNEIQCLQHLE